MEFQVGAGVHGVMFPGFASEYYKLTDDERDRLTAILLDRARTGDTATVISLPDHATRIAVNRAISAVERGATTLNILPPYQQSPSASAVLEHVVAVARAISPVPVIL